MPRKIAEREIYKSNIFHIHEVDLDFDGQKCTYEYLKSADSVMAVAVTNKREILFVKEYAAAFDNYFLTLPKGGVEEFESFEQAVQKELQEEVGYKAQTLVKLAELKQSPGYSTHSSAVYLALNLQESVLAGDEPEPLEIVKVPWSQINEYILSGKLTDARSIAALKLAESYLNKDKIRLKQMKFHGNHGFFDFEKENGQDFLIDLELSVDLSRSAKTDDLNDTIDYGAVYEIVKKSFYEKNFDLIEALAAHIGAAVVQEFPLMSVMVEVSKPQVPIKGDLHSSSVCITTFK